MAGIHSDNLGVNSVHMRDFDQQYRPGLYASANRNENSTALHDSESQVDRVEVSPLIFVDDDGQIAIILPDHKLLLLSQFEVVSCRSISILEWVET